ncbi:MAG TPA: VanZ family protein [Bryobacteraceae bacterium]|nr:VanZ family protein [Bryobacteraceae bacterium]
MSLAAAHSQSAAQTNAHRRILAIVVALILYGSLYPWEFHARHYAHNPLWILLHTWPGRFDRYLGWDIAVNVTLYVPLGIFGFLAVRAGAPGFARILAPLALALGLSASIEMLQLFDDSRTCSLSDVASNTVGAAVGIAAGGFYRAQLQRFLARRGTVAMLRPSGALLLLSCWFAYQLFPLFPVWGRSNVVHRLEALGAATAVSPADAVVVFAEWLAVACLLESVRKTKTGGALALLLLVVPLRLILRTRTLAWSDIVGAGAACAAWLCLPRLWVRRAAPVVLAGALILGELAPFHAAAQNGARAFNWVPFRGLFRSDWQDGFVVLFRKSFWYGSLLWLWRASGCSLAWTTAVAAAALFLLEQVQVNLPGRTPEITDSVLAVLMGLLLWLLRDS